jgi:hypothetical protein
VILAYQQGHLTQKSLNLVQNWALAYHFYLVNRLEMEKTDRFLEQQTFNLNPEQWVKFYRNRVLKAVDDPNEIALTEGDLGDLDRYMEEQEKRYAETGSYFAANPDQVVSSMLNNAQTVTDTSGRAWLEV